MKKKELSKFNQLLCGGVAGFVSDSIAHPLDVVRARIVMQRKIRTYHYSGTFNALRTIIRNDGIRGMYKGYAPVFLGTFPAHALYFFSYEKAKRSANTFLNKRGGKKVSDDRFLVSLCAGFAADVVGSFLWCPMEVLKQNMMVWEGKTQIQVIREVYAREGFMSFYRGYFAGLWTFAPYVMLNFAFYEKFKSFTARLLGKDRNKLPTITYFFCATSSSYLSSLLTTPLCVGRTRIQCLEDRRNTNIMKEMLTVIREDGWYALLEVWRTRALWFAIGTATTFMVYEYVKNKMILKREEDEDML